MKIIEFEKKEKKGLNCFDLCGTVYLSFHFGIG
jgi:hypothetical protein